MNTLQGPPDHTELLAKDSSENYSMGLNAGDTGTFDMNLLMQGLEENMEATSCLQYSPCPENVSGFVNFHSCETSPCGSDLTQNPLRASSSVFLVDKEEPSEDEEDVNSQLNDLLEDFAILDEMRLLDLALDEGLSSEATAGLEVNDNGLAITEDQGEATTHGQGNSPSSLKTSDVNYIFLETHLH